jgi:hypothetical protein
VVKNKYYGMGLIAIVAGIIFFLFVFETRENKIKKPFKYIAEKLEKSPGESPIISAAKANHFVRVFIDPSVIDIPAYSFSREISPDDFSTYILTMRSRYTQLSMKFHDFFIEDIDEKTVLVTVTAGVRGVLKSGESVEDIHEVECTLQEIEDVWNFSKIEVVDVLEK